MACLILAEKEVKFTERTILTASHRQTAERLTKEDVARGTLVISRPPVDAVMRLKSYHLSQESGEDCGQEGRGLEKKEVTCSHEQTCLLLCCCLLGGSLLGGGGGLLSLDGLCDLLRG